MAEEMKEKDFKVGDVCLYDKEDGKIIVVEFSRESLNNFPKEGYTPVGVVVIPSSHDVYGTGECGVMSLKSMSYSTPDEGSTSTTMKYWGGYGTDINELTNYTTVAITGTTENTGDGSVTGTATEPWLPSDNFSSIPCPNDENSHYFYCCASYNVAPSPYLTDGSRNPNYFMINNPSSPLNVLSDFNGMKNTEIICSYATSQINWKTDNMIINTYITGYYPAACCCWRYHTEGTKQGQWYLPAMGELGYVMTRLKKINATIADLVSVYGESVGVQLSMSNDYWSSSEHSSNTAIDLNTGFGSVDYYGKCYKFYVRAFMRL